jgi:hypothetical protein
LPKESTGSSQEPFIEYSEEEDEEGQLLDSLASFNRRGCDEIMSQFMKDLDLSYSLEKVSGVEKEIEPKNYFKCNLETIM